MRDQKHRLARLIHLRPELQARHCQEPRAGNKPCLGCHCHRACSCGQGGARACQHDRDPPARPRDTPPDGHQSLLAAPTPVQTSQSSPCLFMPLPLEATKWILKLPSSLFPFLLPPCSSLSSDHPGTGLLSILVSCCALKHESLHDRGHSCQARGLARPVSPRALFSYRNLSFHRK